MQMIKRFIYILIIPVSMYIFLLLSKPSNINKIQRLIEHDVFTFSRSLMYTRSIVECGQEISVIILLLQRGPHQ